MKKLFVLTVRLDSETDEALRAIALADDRTLAWVARKLIIEALQARKAIKSRADKPHPAANR